jgi:hypothetical protein
MGGSSGNSGPALSFLHLTPVPHSLKAHHKRALLSALILHIIHFLDHVQNFTFSHESLSKTPLQFKGRGLGGWFTRELNPIIS